MSIGENIKKIRVQKGLTQKQLGELCGMADSAIRRYENGRANPKLYNTKVALTFYKRQGDFNANHREYPIYFNSLLYALVYMLKFVFWVLLLYKHLRQILPYSFFVFLY